MTGTKAWVKKTTNNDIIGHISRKTGLPYMSVKRRYLDDAFTAGDVILIARAYGASPVDALEETGFITHAERAAARDTNGMDTGMALTVASDEALVGELSRRLEDARGAAPTV
ncbi:hypothetical protein ACLUWO_08585 [Pseudoscardovia radai]|uniref:hypothetical protein n=1 Tax=Pseudoscardovia radai TaxID=987066 RepID=UPI00399390A4